VTNTTIRPDLYLNTETFWRQSTLIIVTSMTMSQQRLVHLSVSITRAQIISKQFLHLILN